MQKPTPSSHNEQIARLKAGWDEKLDRLQQSADELTAPQTPETTQRFSTLKDGGAELTKELEEATESLCFNRLGGSNILVVEDDAAVRTVMIRALSNKGFIVSYACDGKAALEQLFSGHYGLVFLDLNLPMMDGFDVVRQVRDQWKMDVEIFVITGRFLSDQENLFLAQHACVSILKPIDMQTLVKLAVVGSNRIRRRRQANGTLPS